MSTKNYSFEICDPSITDDKRLELWLVIYFTKWDCFQIEPLNALLNDSITMVHDMLKEKPMSDSNASDIDIKELEVTFGVASDKNSNHIDKVKGAVNDIFKSCVNSSSTEAAIRKMAAMSVIDMYVCAISAAAIAEKTNNRDGFMNILEKLMKKRDKERAQSVGFSHFGLVQDLLKAKYPLDQLNAVVNYGCQYGFSNLMKNLINPNPVAGTANFVGSLTADLVLHAFGVENKSVHGYVGASAGVASSALVSGLWFLSMTAAATAGAVAAAGVGIAESVSGIRNSLERGDKDSWCYIEVGHLRRNQSKTISISMYKGRDWLKLVPYQSIKYSSDSCDFFSPGNHKEDHFQITLYDEWGNKIRAYDRVWHRDTFFVSKHPKKESLIIVYARGDLNKDLNLGLVDFYEHVKC